MDLPPEDMLAPITKSSRPVTRGKMVLRKLIGVYLAAEVHNLRKVNGDHLTVLSNNGGIEGFNFGRIVPFVSTSRCAGR
jgi:hypothetical protein